MDRSNDTSTPDDSPNRSIKVGDIIRYYEKTVVAQGHRTALVYSGQTIQVTAITYVDGTQLLWSGQDCYLGSEAYPAQWMPEDFASILQLINIAISFDELAEVTRILKILCTQSLKEQVWNMLPPIAKTKLITHQQAAIQRSAV